MFCLCLDREISAVVNAVGHIPCSVGSFHDVSMILWFKDSSGSPIYRYEQNLRKSLSIYITLARLLFIHHLLLMWPFPVKARRYQ